MADPISKDDETAIKAFPLKTGHTFVATTNGPKRGHFVRLTSSRPINLRRELPRCTTAKLFQRLEDGSWVGPHQAEGRMSPWPPTATATAACNTGGRGAASATPPFETSASKRPRVSVGRSTLAVCRSLRPIRARGAGRSWSTSGVLGVG